MAAALVVAAIVLATAPVACGMNYTEHDLASEKSLWALYERWCAHYAVPRDLSEKTWRFDLFKENARRIHEFNQGDEPYWLSLNRFSDMTDAEFSRSYGCARTTRMSDDGAETKKHQLQQEDVDGGRQNSTHGGAIAPQALPRAVDWRGRSVTRVKNQGEHCGSCWAFAATATVEGIHAIRTRQLVALSEQQLMDCDTAQNRGCIGGWTEKAFEFIVNNRGIVPESAYPYRARQGTCRRVWGPVVTIDGYRRVPPFDQGALMAAIAAQPVAVAIEGESWAFRHYGGGVFRGQCGLRVAHAVTAVGYGADRAGGGNFWVVKNSWGPGWGEGGFVRMSRDVPNREGICGILTDSSYPVKR